MSGLECGHCIIAIGACRGRIALFPCTQVLAPYAREININSKIMALYLDHLLPGITQPGVDNNFGSSACYDVLALQVAYQCIADARTCMTPSILCIQWLGAV